MGPSQHLRILLRRLESGEMGWSQVMNIAKNMPTTWRTQEWRRTRDSRLGCQCGACGSKDNLVLQHTWHPAYFYPLLKEVGDELIGEYKRTNPQPSVDLLNSTDRFYALRAWRDGMMAAWRDRIYGEATRRSLLGSLRYLVMRPEDTSTRCKTCAFREDAANGLVHEHSKPSPRVQHTHSRA